MFANVKIFREKMGLPIGQSPKLLSAEETSYFARFIMEELSEYLKANEEGSIVDAADALADLVYVSLGCAHAMGLPFDEIFDAVHFSNMLKVPANPALRSMRGMAYDVVKPITWIAPEPKIKQLIVDKLNKDLR